MVPVRTRTRHEFLTRVRTGAINAYVRPTDLDTVFGAVWVRRCDACDTWPGT
ncbi:hypothetical protein FTUN_7954 [Frigoriglobus tundricola]|uniref:Uncharacterized protein n=1 Tax=Frigoriglobus tundricola TaxID=2774151 RepID=A0A6M5Z1N0_9BACT|nr:hypothetical protein FTUN_7954 [Frigoriglobus tundricola]